jgi:hypothetical protein
VETNGVEREEKVPVERTGDCPRLSGKEEDKNGEWSGGQQKTLHSAQKGNRRVGEPPSEPFSLFTERPVESLRQVSWLRSSEALPQRLSAVFPPAPAGSDMVERGFPFTVAGPRRICTGFPFTPSGHLRLKHLRQYRGIVSLSRGTRCVGAAGLCHFSGLPQRPTLWQILDCCRSGGGCNWPGSVCRDSLQAVGHRYGVCGPGRGSR